MRNFCFCTLAIGSKYALMARQLADDLARYAPQATFVVFSDYPHLLAGRTNTRVFAHRQRSVMGYHDKLCVLSKCLENYETCIFLDADGRITAEVDLEEQVFEPGVCAYRIRSWSYNKEEARQAGQPPTEGDARIMQLLREEYKITEPDDDVPFVVEYLFAVTRHPGTDAFLRRWDELAYFCERRRFFVHEGYAIALAALLTSIPLKQHDFRGLNFFEPKFPYDDNRAIGRHLTREVHDSLRSSALALKSDATRRTLMQRLERRAKRELRWLVRCAGGLGTGASLLG